MKTAVDRRRLLAEISGGFGDIGLLAPLAVSLITLNHLNATVVLAGAGIFYVTTALIFRLPVPVQPLKAVSAIAIASGLGPPGIAAAGLMIGVIFVALSVTNLTSVLRRIFVAPVVRGIQLSIGLLLAQAAIGLMARKQQLTLGSGPLDGVGISYAVMLGVVVLVLLLTFQRRALAGGSLAVLAVGGLLGLLVGVHQSVHLAFGPAPVRWQLPSAADFSHSFWVLVVPQVGLSIGNSVIATAATADALLRCRRGTGDVAQAVAVDGAGQPGGQPARGHADVPRRRWDDGALQDRSPHRSGHRRLRLRAGGFGARARRDRASRPGADPGRGAGGLPPLCRHRARQPGIRPQDQG